MIRSLCRPVQQKKKITYRYAITSQKAVRRKKSQKMNKIMMKIAKSTTRWLNNDKQH